MKRWGEYKWGLKRMATCFNNIAKEVIDETKSSMSEKQGK